MNNCNKIINILVYFKHNSNSSLIYTELHNKKHYFTHLFHPNVCRHDLILQVLKKKTEREMDEHRV